ncbi:TPA: hypothetical protein J1716_005107, partial [Escherichia coli]|nr:hypothetical protein [Citrobacter freundii]HBB0232845.1 hypothetical protein [Escherichia coli]HED3094441.1 hypothetical protein [Citrobacter freundii]
KKKEKKLNSDIKAMELKQRSLNQIDEERNYYYDILNDAKEALSDIVKQPFKTMKDLKDFLTNRKNTLKSTTYEQTEEEKNINKNNELEEKPLSRAVNLKIMDKDTLQQKLAQNEQEEPKVKAFKM